LSRPPAPPRDVTPGVLPLGTVVLTMEGALPVEYLGAGDRIVSRAEMQVLRSVDTPAPRRFALTFDRPQVVYTDGRQVRCAAARRPA